MVILDSSPEHRYFHPVVWLIVGVSGVLDPKPELMSLMNEPIWLTWKPTNHKLRHSEACAIKTWSKNTCDTECQGFRIVVITVCIHIALLRVTGLEIHLYLDDLLTPSTPVDWLQWTLNLIQYILILRRIQGVTVVYLSSNPLPWDLTSSNQYPTHLY